MLSSPAAWVTTVPTPTICTTYYECGPTPGSRAWQCKLRGVHRLPVFSPSIEKDQVQRLRCVQSALCGAYVRRRSPSRPLRRACGDHGGTHDGVAGGAHSSVGMPRPGRRPARPTPGGAGGAQALVAGDTGVGTTRPTTFGGPCYRRRTHLAISGLTCLCSCATPVFRIEGFDHGPRGNLLGLCRNGLCDGRAGNGAQTTLLLQEPRLLRWYGVHSLNSVGINGLCRLEGLALRGRAARYPGDAEYPGGMPGHLLHPRSYSRTLLTVYACRCHDAPAQASDRMAPYPGTVRVPRAAGRLAHASDAVVEACRIKGLSESDTQRALATIRLVAVMRDPSSETQQITPDAARKLYELQEEILCDDVLASKISWAAGWRSRAHEPQTVKSAPLHDALKAALELVDNHGESEGVRTPPLWYYIVAVSAADAKMIDPIHLSMHLRDGAEHRAAVEAYDVAKRALRMLEDHD